MIEPTTLLQPFFDVLIDAVKQTLLKKCPICQIHTRVQYNHPLTEPDKRALQCDLLRVGFSPLQKKLPQSIWVTDPVSDPDDANALTTDVYVCPSKSYITLQDALNDVKKNSIDIPTFTCNLTV